MGLDRWPPDYSPRDVGPRALDEHEPVVLRPLEVVVVDGKIDKAIRKLKRKLGTEGVMKELKRRRRALKPSAKKRKKEIDARRRRLKRERAHRNAG